MPRRVWIRDPRLCIDVLMTVPAPSTSALPPWASDLVTLYESNALNQFILHGNVNDRMVLPAPTGSPVLGNLQQFLLDVLMPRFDVVLSYDLGNGVRIERGGQAFTKWPGWKESEPLPKGPAPPSNSSPTTSATAPTSRDSAAAGFPSAAWSTRPTSSPRHSRAA